MRKTVRWARWLALLVPATLQAAILPLQGVYGSREVCDAIRATGSAAKVWDDPTLEGIMFAPEGYRDSETNCTWDKVTDSGDIYTDPRPPYGVLGLSLRR